MIHFDHLHVFLVLDLMQFLNQCIFETINDAVDEAIWGFKRHKGKLVLCPPPSKKKKK